MFSFCKKTLMLTDIKDLNSFQKNVIGVLKIEKNLKGVNLTIKINVKENEDNLCLALKIGDNVKMFENLKQNAYIFKLDTDIELDCDINAVIYSKPNLYLYAGFLGKNKVSELIYHLDSKNAKPVQKETKTIDLLSKEPRNVELQEPTEVDKKQRPTGNNESEIDKEQEETKVYENISNEHIESEEISYNDEIIATENYYKAEDISLISLKKELNDKIENLNSESEILSFLNNFLKTKTLAVTYEDQQEEIKVDESEINELKKTMTNDQQERAESNENEQVTEENLEYYKQVESQIEALFSIYPSEENLQKLISGSRFVKIDFNDDGKYYVVGVVYEGNKPEYICYGVPDNHENGVPSELLGYAEWLPVKIDEENDGYWLMYQDTKEGKCITQKSK